MSEDADALPEPASGLGHPVTPAIAEFGYEAAAIGAGDGLAHLDSWGTGPFVIIAGGKSFRFEDSDRFGPSLIKKNGDILANPWPSERSPFWRAHRIWRRQGRRVANDGTTCIWDEPKPNLVQRIGKRTLFLIQPSEEDGAYIEVAQGIEAEGGDAAGGSVHENPTPPVDAPLPSSDLTSRE